MQADEPLGTFMDYCTYGHMIDNVVLLVTGTLHERDVTVSTTETLSSTHLPCTCLLVMCLFTMHTFYCSFFLVHTYSRKHSFASLADLQCSSVMALQLWPSLPLCGPVTLCKAEPTCDHSLHHTGTVQVLLQAWDRAQA